MQSDIVTFFFKYIFDWIVIFAFTGNLLFYCFVMYIVKKSYKDSGRTNIFFFILFIHGVADISKS